MAVEEGQQAPDFTLLDTARQPRSLSEFRGRNVVLAFFPGAFTGGCTNEACTLRDNTEKYNSLNAQVVGVSVDSPFAQKGWADVNNIAFPLLSDNQRAVTAQYGVEVPNFLGMEGYTAANRAVFLLDKDGTVRYKAVVGPGNQPDFDKIEEALRGLAP